jgi:hypothetical protein
MITWPKSLVTEIARKRCVLFLGAGVTASATSGAGKRPKEWKEFLRAAVDLVHEPVKKSEINDLIDQNRLLLALQAIRDEADPGDYHGLLNECFNDLTFVPSDLHKAIFNLDSRLVITTNFDKIYEKYCLTTSTEGFKVIPYYSGSLGDEIRSDTSLIIKAHGTIDEITQMIFTKAEYHAAKEKHASFYAILKALLLTNTCIFIGCGMDDPDVLLLLEEVRITANPNRPHYALLKAGSISQYVKQDLTSAYNVRTLEYGPEHADLLIDLQELQSQIDAIRAIS